MLFRSCSSRIRLVIVGEGPERAKIEMAAVHMGLTDQLVMPGFLPDPHRYIGLFDILANSSLSEQFPISVVEAMAAGVPVAAVPAGDISQMVSEANRPYITQHSGEVDLRNAIEALAMDPAARAAVGKANRAKAVAEYDERTMIADYARLYETVIGRTGALS